MRLYIHHSTHYRYDQAATRVVQVLRLWPQSDESQSVKEWRVEVNGQRLPPTANDGFGNLCATHSIDYEVDSVRIRVDGHVVTRDTHGVLGDSDEPLPPAFYLAPSRLTEADEAIEDLARAVEPADDGDVGRLHRLMATVRERVDYLPHQTDAETRAPDALAAGVGVCQDHAHVLIAAARTLGFPARYVSGYLSAGPGDEPAASHAWAEIHVPDLGWVGFDAANRVCPNQHYVRAAVGRDYHDAAPVRGVRHGGVAETLEVRVHIAESAQAQQ